MRKGKQSNIKRKLKNQILKKKEHIDLYVIKKIETLRKKIKDPLYKSALISALKKTPKGKLIISKLSDKERKILENILSIKF